MSPARNSRSVPGGPKHEVEAKGKVIPFQASASVGPRAPERATLSEDMAQVFRPVPVADDLQALWVLAGVGESPTAQESLSRLEARIKDLETTLAGVCDVFEGRLDDDENASWNPAYAKAAELLGWNRPTQQP